MLLNDSVGALISSDNHPFSRTPKGAPGMSLPYAELRPVLTGHRHWPEGLGTPALLGKPLHPVGILYNQFQGKPVCY